MPSGAFDAFPILQSFLFMMKKLINDETLWDTSLRDVVKDAFQQVAGSDKICDVVEFEQWLNRGWLALKTSEGRAASAVTKDASKEEPNRDASMELATVEVKHVAKDAARAEMSAAASGLKREEEAADEPTSVAGSAAATRREASAEAAEAPSLDAEAAVTAPSLAAEVAAAEEAVEKARSAVASVELAKAEASAARKHRAATAQVPAQRAAAVEAEVAAEPAARSSPVVAAQPSVARRRPAEHALLSVDQLVASHSSPAAMARLSRSSPRVPKPRARAVRGEPPPNPGYQAWVALHPVPTADC